MARDKLIALAKKTAALNDLDGPLVCAVCEQESGWNTFAIRYERGFYVRYIEGNTSLGNLAPTEMMARAFSWGLMQVMGQVARESGFDGMFLSSLCDPNLGIDVGCKVLKHKLATAGGDVEKGLLAWNGGANPSYPAQVLARQKFYEQPAMGVEESTT